MTMSLCITYFWFLWVEMISAAQWQSIKAITLFHITHFVILNL